MADMKTSTTATSQNMTQSGGILSGTKDTLIGAIAYTGQTAYSIGERIGILPSEEKLHDVIESGVATLHNAVHKIAYTGKEAKK
jgi:hypothetical protein